MPVLDGRSKEIYIICSTLTYLLGIGATTKMRQFESAYKQPVQTTETHGARILALTGMSSLEDKRRAFEAGVDG